MDNFEAKTQNAFKWSTITEIIARVLQPLTNMILARILLPEAFGVIATVMMIVAFAEVFVENGFQKFLIQYNFHDDKEEREYLSVAFWTNLAFSIFILIIIIIFRKELSWIVGNPELGTPLAVISTIVPIYGIVGIQNCRLRKSLNFKKLFYVRIAAALVPVVVTIPCALIGMDFWALIVGNVMGVIVRSVMLFIVDRFVPLLYFDKKKLIHMLKAGVWTLLDGLAVWATLWLDTLLISRNLSNYHLGIYKNSITTITEFVAIVTSAVTPVLFASLSRIQDDDKAFKNLFLSVQHTLTMFLLPMGVGLYFYRDLATQILFGDGWSEAANIVGIMSLTIVLRTIFVSFYSEAYRAKGKFQIPLYLQLVDIAILVPTCIIALKYGFWALVYARAFVRLDLIIPEIIIIWIVCKIKFTDTLKVVAHSFVATIVMAIVIYGLQSMSVSILWQFISIGISIIVYFCVYFAFSEERRLYAKSINKIAKRIGRKR